LQETRKKKVFVLTYGKRITQTRCGSKDLYTAYQFMTRVFVSRSILMGCNDGLMLFQNNLERSFNTRCMDTIKDYKRVYCRILKLLLSYL